MKAYRTYTVIPKLPANLTALRAIAYNLWWTWTPDAIDLLRRVDFDLWEQYEHNPVLIFGHVSQQRWQELAESDSFIQHLQQVEQRFYDYLRSETWFDRTYPEHKDLTVAYFGLEYGLTECLPMYAGGLGVLAGDHLQSASDMGLPLHGVGLLYQVGYFRQYLNPDGWQQEEYEENDFRSLPVEPVISRDEQISITIPLDDRQVTALIWRVNVGRVPLYLMDTNTEANCPEDRQITYQLYGGDNSMRVRQEKLLGVGGVRLLKRLGVDATVCHMNEGHACFAALERIRSAIEEHGLSFEEALEANRVGNVFTTHTPVPAGHDRFHPDLMDEYFSEYRDQLQLKRTEFLDLGREHGSPGEEFCTTVLALKLSSWRNGVSKLHGRVSRRMWQSLWPLVPQSERPIRAITNGVHVGSFISDDMATLFDRYLGEQWRTEPGQEATWQRVRDIPDGELWRTHERRRERLVAVARKLYHKQLERRGAGEADLSRASEVLDPEILTIGFARRFATYKRATLIMRDMDRLKALLTHKQRPVQFIFAGKAHPHDRMGKELIREVVHLGQDPQLRQRIVFLEDYDLNLARYIVQGSDVWLNTPRRPQEASGTSGMKAAANGALNCSVLDGWWDEAYEPGIGWAVGRGEVYDDSEQQDQVESQALYTLLEQEIAPLFYDRGADGIPHGWTATMKRSMSAICPYFNSNRMISDYIDRFYIPAARRRRELAAADYTRAKKLVEWLSKIKKAWSGVSFHKVTDDAGDTATYDDRIVVRAEISLGNLSPDDIIAHLQYGNVDSTGDITEPRYGRMEYVGAGSGDNTSLFMGTIACDATGRWGYTIRVLPHHPDLVEPYDAVAPHWLDTSQ